MRPRHVRDHLSRQYNLKKKNISRSHAHSFLCFLHAIPLFSSLPSRLTSTTATQIVVLISSFMPNRHTDRCSPLFLHAEPPPPPHRSPTGAHRHKFRRSCAWSLETNWSRREPQSKGLFFMIFPFPQFGFRIGCSEFLFASSESFKF